MLDDHKIQATSTDLKDMAQFKKHTMAKNLKVKFMHFPLFYSPGICK